MRKVNQPKLCKVLQVQEQNEDVEERFPKDSSYEQFLKQQTHQLKKLFHSLRYPRRLTSLDKASVTLQTQPLKHHCEPRVPTVLTAYTVPTSQTLQLTTFDMRALTTQNFHKSKRKKYEAELQKLNPSHPPKHLLSEYYRERRREIEDSLFIGGKGYESERGSTAKQSLNPRKSFNSRQLSQKLRMSLRKHQKDRYVYTPSR